jgi:hypothetical protein
MQEVMKMLACYEYIRKEKKRIFSRKTSSELQVSLKHHLYYRTWEIISLITGNQSFIACELQDYNL